MASSKKIFLGGINQDDVDYLVDPKEYLNALNLRFVTSESGGFGRMSTIEGTTLKNVTINNLGVKITWTPPFGVNEPIGSFSDTVNRRLFWFNWNSAGSHGIYCFDFDDDLIYTVLRSADVEGGLNFQRDKFIHSSAIVDNLLYWTDNVNEPRRVNVDSGIKLYHPTYQTTDRPYSAPIGASVISVAKPQPVYPMTATFTGAGAAVNNIDLDGFQATYRYVFKDREVSSFSSLSNLIKNPGSGFITFKIPVSEKIPQDVDKIELAVRYYSDKRVVILKTWERSSDPTAFTQHNSGVADKFVFDFYNNEIGVSVDNATAVRLSDNVPLAAGTLEIARNRLFLGNTISGYESPTQTSLSIEDPSLAAPSDSATAFKSGSAYKLGVVFYDKFGRSCGVVTNESLTSTIPDRNESLTSVTTRINWVLNATDRLLQIPEWASYYSIVRTKSRNKSSFLQFKPTEIRNVSKNDDGTYNLSATNNLTGFAFNASDLFKFGLGYAFRPGDIALIYDGSTVQTAAVTDDFADFIITERAGLSITTASIVFMEIYSPSPRTEQEFFYEVANKYPVVNPGTPARNFSTFSGFLEGDVTIKQRNSTSTYFAEAMNRNDKVWSQWWDNTGRTFIESSAKVERRQTNVVFSNVYNTGVNGLSTFDTLDFYQMPIELGSLQRLILASKVQLEGNVMLGYFTEETASIYLGESQVFDATGASFLAKASGVIGQVNVLKGSFGTVHPESVFEWEGAVMSYDANKGAWVRYDSNGLFPISYNKMQKYFRKVGQDILDYAKGGTEYPLATPGIPLRVIGSADPYHGEFITTVPRMYIGPKNDIIGDMELSSTDISFETTNPSISVSPGSLSAFTYEVTLGPSESKSFVITASGLDAGGSIVVTAPAPYEVSLDNVNFSQSVTFDYVSTSLSLTVHVRLDANLSVGSYSGVNVSVSSSGVTQNVSLSGSVTASTTPLLFATPGTLSSFTYEEFTGPSETKTFDLTGYALAPASGNITLTYNNEYELSLDGVNWVSTSITIPYTGGALPTTNIKVRLKVGLSDGVHNGTVNIFGGSAQTSVSLFGFVSIPGTFNFYFYNPISLGLTALEACQESGAVRISSLYSDTPPEFFGTGAALYFRDNVNFPILGYFSAKINGQLWDIDDATGIVVGLSVNQC